MDKEIDIDRAWKDEEYRKSLTPQQLAQLSPNLNGDGELSEEDLENTTGGRITNVRNNFAMGSYYDSVNIGAGD